MVKGPQYYRADNSVFLRTSNIVDIFIDSQKDKHGVLQYAVFFGMTDSSVRKVSQWFLLRKNAYEAMGHIIDNLEDMYE